MAIRITTQSAVAVPAQREGEVGLATQRLLNAFRLDCPLEMERELGVAVRDGADFSQLPKSSRVLSGLLLILPFCLSDRAKVEEAIHQQITGGVTLQKEGPFLEKLQQGFCSAIRLKKVQAVMFFLAAGLNLDFEVHGKSPLEFAVRYGNDTIIQMVRAHSDKGVIDAVALLVAERSGLPGEYFQPFSLTDGAKQHLHTKAVAHFYNIFGMMPDGSKSLEGGYPHIMVPYLAEALADFHKDSRFDQFQIKGEMQSLIDAILEICPPESTDEERAAKIRAGGLCFVNAGWSGHAVSLCFMGGYMAICNRGEGSIWQGTMKVFKIDQEKVTPELLERIEREEKDSTSQQGAQFLYSELPELLDGVQDELCREFVKVAPKWQKIGVCSLASPKAAIRFAWIMLLIAQGVEHPFEVGRDESKAFTEFAAQNLLKKHGENMVAGFQEMVRFRVAVNYKQWRTRVRAHPNFLIRGVGRVAGWVMSVSLPILSLIASGGQS